MKKFKDCFFLLVEREIFGELILNAENKVT